MFANKKSFYDYEILEQYDCGIVLEGWEVKAIADKKCSIVGTHCKIFNGEAFLVGASIGSSDNDQMRSRKLLLHKSEINRLIGKTQEKGLSLVPIKLYSTRGKFKLVIGVGKGKKEYDKRETEKKRSIEDDNRRIIKSQKLS